jgi:hypothetical protein
MSGGRSGTRVTTGKPRLRRAYREGPPEPWRAFSRS